MHDAIGNKICACRGSLRQNLFEPYSALQKLMRKWWLARSALTAFRWCPCKISHEHRIAASFVMKLKKERESGSRTWSLMWSMTFVGGPDAMGSDQWCSSSHLPDTLIPKGWPWRNFEWSFWWGTCERAMSSQAVGDQSWTDGCQKSSKIHLWSFHYCVLCVSTKLTKEREIVYASNCSWLG